MGHNVKEQNKILLKTGWNFQVKGSPLVFIISQRSRTIDMVYDPANHIIHSFNIYGGPTVYQVVGGSKDKRDSAIS